jgi:hypothetical protein
LSFWRAKRKNSNPFDRSTRHIKPIERLKRHYK